MDDKGEEDWKAICDLPAEVIEKSEMELMNVRNKHFNLLVEGATRGHTRLYKDQANDLKMWYKALDSGDVDGVLEGARLAGKILKLLAVGEDMLAVKKIKKNKKTNYSRSYEIWLDSEKNGQDWAANKWNISASQVRTIRKKINDMTSFISDPDKKREWLHTYLSKRSSGEDVNI